jgi:hypothetical protein
VVKLPPRKHKKGINKAKTTKERQSKDDEYIEYSMAMGDEL